MQDNLSMDIRRWIGEGMQFWVGTSKVKGKVLEKGEI